MLYHDCRDGNGEADPAPDQTVVVTNVVETVMPDSTSSRRAEDAVTWEKLLTQVE